MTQRHDNQVFEKSLGFFGAITASHSHEINNIVTNINEIAGLSHDLLVAADQGRPADPDRQKELLKRIAAQVQRGNEAIQKLNRFAHSVDEPVGQMDARESLEQIAALCQRFARMRKVELEFKAPEEPVYFEGSPFDLQHLLYRMIEIAFDISNQGDRVVLGLEACGDGARYTLESPRPYQAAEEGASEAFFLASMVGRLGGSIESDLRSGQPVSLKIVLPRVLENRSVNT